MILCPIFAARETNTYGISSQDIAKRISQAETASDLADAAARLGRLVQPGDLVFLMGAGNVNQIAELLEDVTLANKIVACSNVEDTIDVFNITE